MCRAKGRARGIGARCADLHTNPTGTLIYPPRVARPNTPAIGRGTPEERDLKSHLLTRVRDAEEAASARIAEAEADAKKIVSDGRREADRVLVEGRQTADADYQKAIAAAREEADAEAKKILTNGKRKATALGKKFDGEVDAAASRVLKAFEESL